MNTGIEGVLKVLTKELADASHAISMLEAEVFKLTEELKKPTAAPPRLRKSNDPVGPVRRYFRATSDAGISNLGGMAVDFYIDYSHPSQIMIRAKVAICADNDNFDRAVANAVLSSAEENAYDFVCPVMYKDLRSNTSLKQVLWCELYERSKKSRAEYEKDPRRFCSPRLSRVAKKIITGAWE